MYHTNELLEYLDCHESLVNSLMAATLEGSIIASCLVIWWPRTSISCQDKLILGQIDDEILLL